MTNTPARTMLRIRRNAYAQLNALNDATDNLVPGSEPFHVVARAYHALTSALDGDGDLHKAMLGASIALGWTH